MDDRQDLATVLAATYGANAGSVTPPIYQTSLFTFDSFQAFEDRMAGKTGQSIYTRVQNPTVAAFEAMMADAEEGGGRGRLRLRHGGDFVNPARLFETGRSGSPASSMSTPTPTVCSSACSARLASMSPIIRQGHSKMIPIFSTA